MAGRAFNPFIGDLVNQASARRTAVTARRVGRTRTTRSSCGSGAGGIGRPRHRLAARPSSSRAPVRCATRPCRSSVEREGWLRVLARVDDVPGFGWTTWTGDPLDGRTRRAPMPTARSLDNGLVRVEVDATTARFAVNGLAGLGRLVDDGDAGDTYNYSPPADDTVVDTPSDVRVEVEEAGPLRGPSARHPDVHVARAGRGRRPARARARSRSSPASSCAPASSLVRVETSFDNPSRDHRLRAWFPLPTRATDVACRVRVRRRRARARSRGRAPRAAVPTFPSRRFVQAGGLTVVHEGLLEYELVDDGRRPRPHAAARHRPDLGQRRHDATARGPPGRPSPRRPRR